MADLPIPISPHFKPLSDAGITPGSPRLLRWRRPSSAADSNGLCTPSTTEAIDEVEHSTEACRDLGPTSKFPADHDFDILDAIPWADRRMNDRKIVQPGSRIEIRRWGDPAGPDMAHEIQDVSESGVRVRLWTRVRRGERLDITFWGPGAAWCGRGMGIVCWSVIGEPGEVVAGLRLSRRLTERALRALSESSVARFEFQKSVPSWVVTSAV
jgi:hypothetical protein